MSQFTSCLERLLTKSLDLRSKVNPNPGFTIQVEPEEAVLGDKAVGGLDNDKDHVPNVESGLKA